MIDQIEKELRESADVLQRFMSERANLERISEASDLIVECFKQGGSVYSCGNGGSMCDAMHFAEELSGRFRNDRPALPAAAISDPGHITCVSNDFGFEHIFSRYITAFGKKGDVLLAISTSGNSPNILNASKEAKAKGLKVIGLTGKDGGGLKDLCDIEIRVVHKGYADRIQEIHIKVIHCLILLTERKLFNAEADYQ